MNAKKDLHPNAKPRDLKIKKLISSLQAIEKHVDGSDASRQTKCLELIQLCKKIGSPHIFFTLSPTDIHHPLVQLLAGKDVQFERVIETMALSPSFEKHLANIAIDPYL